MLRGAWRGGQSPRTFAYKRERTSHLDTGGLTTQFRCKSSLDPTDSHPTGVSALYFLLMKFLALTAAVASLIVAIIAFFSNLAMGVLSLAAAGASFATWLVYKKQSK